MPKITARFLPPNFVRFGVDAGPHKPVKRVFGKREIVDRVEKHSVTIRLNTGEEMAFPLPESDCLAILRPVGTLDLAGKRLLIEWSLCDKEKLEPIACVSICPPKYRAVLNGIYSNELCLGWILPLSLERILSEGDTEAYIFKIPEDGFQVSHRDGKTVRFRFVDGKCIEDGYFE